MDPDTEPNEPPEPTPGTTPDIPQEMAAEMRALAPTLRAFEPHDFATPPGHSADADRDELAAGALMRAGHIVLTGLFEDMALLTEDGSVAEKSDPIFIPADLPVAFAHHYTHAFVKRFLIATSEVVRGLNQTRWSPNGSVAERLALHLIIKLASATLDIAEIVAWEDGAAMYEPVRSAFSCRNLERLYAIRRGDLPPDLRADPIDDLANPLPHWFRPVPGKWAHPYLLTDS